MTNYPNSEQFTDEGRPIQEGDGDMHPSAGGCWFCHRETAETHFSWEFDAFYHRSCAEELGVADATDPVLAYERGDD
jgi:hypothetical protein